MRVTPKSTVFWAAQAPVAMARKGQGRAEGRAELGWCTEGSHRAYKRVTSSVTSGVSLVASEVCKRILVSKAALARTLSIINVKQKQINTKIGQFFFTGHLRYGPEDQYDCPLRESTNYLWPVFPSSLSTALPTLHASAVLHYSSFPKHVLPTPSLCFWRLCFHWMEWTLLSHGNASLLGPEQMFLLKEVFLNY